MYLISLESLGPDKTIVNIGYVYEQKHCGPALSKYLLENFEEWKIFTDNEYNIVKNGKYVYQFVIMTGYIKKGLLKLPPIRGLIGLKIEKLKLLHE